MIDASHPDDRFEALSRGSVLAAIESKLVSYVAIADRRAQGLLGIVAILIPLVLTRIETSYCRDGVVVFVAFAFLTVACCTLAMAPKRYSSETMVNPPLFHFSGFSNLDEQDYLRRIRETLADSSALSEAMARELYHMGRDVLRPKFRWLRLAYLSFLTGLAVSLLLTLFSFFQST